MHPRDRLQKALQKIGVARASIVKTAAAWQAEGVETSPLAEPLIHIQEAVAQLETLAASLPGQDATPFVGVAKPAGEPAGDPSGGT